MALEIKYLNSTGEFLKLSYEFGDDLPLKRILLSAEAAECKTVLIETNISDDEYIAEYKSFYKNVFTAKPPEECVRIHLFKNFLKSYEKVELDNNKANYLGYCTLRPLKNRKVSDAFISKKIFLEENSKFVYLVCEMTKSITINEVIFEIHGFPYMQQDSRIAACAQTSLRLVSQYLNSKNNESRILTGPEITDLTKASHSDSMEQPSRRIPTLGLNTDQMRIVLEKLGCNPLIYNYALKKPEDLLLERPEQVIYRYLESSLPVIIGINLASNAKHTILAIGHTFNPDYWWHHVSEAYYGLPRTGIRSSSKDSLYHCSVSLIQNFIIQDDNLGPYYFIDSNLLKDIVSCIIIPLPEKVYLTGEEAETHAWEAIYRNTGALDIFKRARKVLNSSNNVNARWINMFFDFSDSGNLIFRTYLRKSEELIKDVEDNKFTRTNLVKEAIRTTPMPEYVWVVEISWPDIFLHMRKKCGELILDATADARFAQSVLFMHIPGVYIKQSRDDVEVNPIIEDDQPFRHLFRTKKPIPANLPVGAIA